MIPDINALKAAESNQNGEEDIKSKDKKAKTQSPPSNKPQLSDEQIEAALAKKDKEIAKRKQEFAWKEAELLDQVNKHERKLGAHPLGRDRAYRRYWVFPTLPGLFVEHDDEFVGACLPSPTPYISEVNLNDLDFIREHFGKVRWSIWSFLLFSLGSSF